MGLLDREGNEERGLGVSLKGWWSQVGPRHVCRKWDYKAASFHLG